MKKKIIISIIIVLIILSAIVFLSVHKSDNYINEKGYTLLGTDYCPKTSDHYQDTNHMIMAMTVLSDYKCQLCNKKYVHSNSATPIICPNCATITNRCEDCGKLKNVN